MEDKLCAEKHKSIDAKLEIHEKRINNHGDRLDNIEVLSSRLDERLANLVTKLGDLTTTIRWFIGLLVGSFVAFFFYAIQQGLFK